MPDMDQSITKVLDHGYIKVIDVMGSDLSVVNAARVSFNKQVNTIEEKDEKLIRFLVKNKHDSPLRHAYMTIEFYAPLMVARQAWKHVVGTASIEDGSSWNESSRRYITENEEFYIPAPDQWRKAPENRKQGSSEPIDTMVGAKYTRRLTLLAKEAHSLYLEALADGVAPEQARLLLPAYSMYVRWRWTASLNALLHFIGLRTGEGAQSEIIEYADAIASEVEFAFPRTTAAWKKYR